MNEIQKRIWYNMYGNYLDVSPDDSNIDFTAKTFGFSAGIDRRFGRFALIGGGIGADWTSIDQSQYNRTGDVSALKGLLYTQFTGSRWYCDLEAGFGTGEYKFIQTGNYGLQKNSNWTSQWNAATELGIHWEYGLAKTEPFITLNRTELNDQSSDNIMTTVAVGCRYNWRFAGPLAVVRPGIYAGYLHQFDDDLFSTGTFIPGATVFRVPHAKPAQDRVFLGMNLVMSMRKSLDLYCKYTTELAKERNSHNFVVGMNWNF